MPFIHEIQFQTKGYTGAPGYTNLYFATTINADRAAQFAAVKSFIQGLTGVQPGLWSGQINPVGRVLEDNTGTLAAFSAAPATAVDVITGIHPQSFGPSVAGFAIGWSTATLNRGRLVRGRTFVVPTTRGMWEPDGTIAPDSLVQQQTNAQALINANVGFGIWSRPRLGVGGLFGVAVSAKVTDRSAFLSSRRA